MGGLEWLLPDQSEEEMLQGNLQGPGSLVNTGPEQHGLVGLEGGLPFLCLPKTP